MPAGGLDGLPRAELLTDDEIIRLVRIAVTSLGVTEVRLTGGEPLLRPGLPRLVARLAAVRPRPEISLTTNGIGLARLAQPLRAGGLDRLNVSLDTLSPEVFKRLARRDRLADVLAGLAAAAAAGLAPVKVNTVLMRHVNDHEAPGLLAFCLAHGYQLRFIEQMPLDAQHGWQRSEMVTADEIMAALSRDYTLTPDDPAARGAAPPRTDPPPPAAPPPGGPAPAETFVVDGGPARVGVIASVTRPFCGTCDRVRLTADGQIRNCLFAQAESDLRAPLRTGAGDEEIAERWTRAVAVKLHGNVSNAPA